MNENSAAYALNGFITLNPSSQFISAVIAYVIFFLSYAWSCRYFIVLASSTNPALIKPYLNSLHFISYIMLLVFVYLLLTVPCTSIQLFYITDKQEYIIATLIICSLLLLLSLLIFERSLRATGRNMFSPYPTQSLFKGIYYRCRHPQTLSFILFTLSIVIFKNSLDALILGIFSIVGVVILALIV